MANFNAIQTGVLIKAFLLGGTAEQIAGKTGYSVNTVYRYIATWHKQGILFMSRWIRHHETGRNVAVWELKVCDSQHDAPRPAPISSKERSEKYIKRKLEAMLQERLDDIQSTKRSVSTK